MKRLHHLACMAFLTLSFGMDTIVLPGDPPRHPPLYRPASQSTADSSQSVSGISILIPKNGRAVTAVGAASITGRVTNHGITSIQFLAPKEARTMLSLPSKETKAGFPKNIRALFPDNFVLTNVHMTTFEAGKRPVRFQYPVGLESNTGLREFWNSITFRKILTEINKGTVVQVEVILRGFQIRTQRIDTSRGGGIFSFSQALAPGLNTFYLKAGSKESSTIDSIELFYENKIQTNRSVDDFQHIAFHSSPIQGECNPCHSNDGGPSCTTCHKGLTNLLSFHPAAEDCSLCHDLSSDKESKLIEAQELNQEFCFTCHDDKKELLEQKPVVHGVATECLTCHDAHGSNNSSLQRDRTIEICKTCHEDIAMKPHPVANHPLENRPDPSRPGKELSCTSCHNPHASDFKFLLREDRMKLCQYCHNK